MAAMKRTTLSLFVLLALGFVSAAPQCANLSDNSTWGTNIMNSSGVLYVNANTSLCTDTYYLNAAAATAMFQMNASNIFLDCNQSIIDGMDNNGYGIYIAGKENNTIENCTARNYQHGFYLYNGAGYNRLALDIAYNNSGDGILISSSNSNTVSNNTVFNNGQHGLYALSSNNTIVDNNTVYGHNTTSFASIHLIRSSFGTIENNQVNSSYWGIWLYAVANDSIVNNTVLTSYREGIRADYTNDSLFMWNYVDGVYQEQAMQLGYDAYRNNVTENEFYNSVDGFHILFAYDNYVYSNIMKYNTNGFTIVYIEGNFIFNNTAEENSQWDFYFAAQNESQCDNFIENNTGTFGLPILFYNETVDIANLEAADIELCDADGSSLSNITILGNRSNRMNIIGSDNTALADINLNSTSDGLIISGFSGSGTPIENVTVSGVHSTNSVWNAISLGRARNVTISDVFINGSRELGIWVYGDTTENTFRNITIINTSYAPSNPTIIVGGIEFRRATSPVANPYDNTFIDVTIYSTGFYIFHGGATALVPNYFYNLTLCRDASPQGCVKWSYLNITNSSLNSTNLILDPTFVSMSESDSGAAQFNQGANITLASACTDPAAIDVYALAGFPQGRADIVANGSIYPTLKSCSGGTMSFNVSSFSGYALGQMTAALAFAVPAHPMVGSRTDVICIASNSEVNLTIYRDGVEVANGTSEIHDIATLRIGTYEYVCNSTANENYTAATASGTMQFVSSSTVAASKCYLEAVAPENVSVGTDVPLQVLKYSDDNPERTSLYLANVEITHDGTSASYTTNTGGYVSFVLHEDGEYAYSASFRDCEDAKGSFVAVLPSGTAAEGATGNGEPGTGCAGGCPAGYGCINVQCIRIGGQETPADAEESGGILPVVASSAWGSGSTEESPAEREVSSGPGQAASPPDGKGGPINPLVIIVPLGIAAVVVLAYLKRKDSR